MEKPAKKAETTEERKRRLAATLMQSLRKHRRGSTGPRKRTVVHNPDAYCVCVDCRKLRGHYPVANNNS